MPYTTQKRRPAYKNNFRSSNGEKDGKTESSYERSPRKPYRGNNHSSDERPFFKRPRSSYRDFGSEGQERQYNDTNEYRQSYSSDDSYTPRQRSSYKEKSSYGDKPSYGDRRRSSGRSPQRMQKNRRTIKKFNPSQFIKRVEETTPATTHAIKHTFADFQVLQILKDNISKKGYVTPTPIQDQAIPAILDGRDIIATANTGTGKTAAFLIPLIHRIASKQAKRALIVTPTRELAAQIQDEFNSLKNNMPLRSVLCIGAMSMHTQIIGLKSKPAFVIGTPGRLKDLANQRYLDFSSFDTVVLDEVDTMLDIKFITDMKEILSEMPSTRHSLFFSATVSPEIQAIIDTYLKDPVAVSVKTRQSAENVNQDVIMVNKRNKIELLHELLVKPEFKKVIVFARTKHGTESLAQELKDRGFGVASIHGNKTQAQRKKSLAAFKSNHAQILLATDVVARGIDIENVSHVINYDLPQTYEDYIHRIGRTGRANNIGNALTFIE